VAPLSKKDKHLPSCSPPSIPILRCLSPINNSVGVTWEVQREKMPLPIFFYIRIIYFLVLVWRGANKKIEISSKPLFGWCTDRKNEKLRFTGRKINHPNTRCQFCLPPPPSVISQVTPINNSHFSYVIFHINIPSSIWSALRSFLVLVSLVYFLGVVIIYPV
jgi:hypothetical protein